MNMREVLKGRPAGSYYTNGEECHYIEGTGGGPVVGAPGTIIRETTTFQLHNRRVTRERIMRQRITGEEVIIDQIRQDYNAPLRD